MTLQSPTDPAGPRHLFELMTVDRILNLPSAQQREGCYIEFKLIGDRGGCLTFTDKDRSNYAELLSAFANSAGGVIVWGVNCKQKNQKDAVIDLPSVQNSGVILDRLRQLQDEDVVPSVQAEHRVECDAQTGKSFIVTYVAKTNGGPHRSLRDHQYFRRTSAGRFRHMEHDELADMFGRRPQPALELVLRPFPRHKDADQPTFILAISNTGRALARFPYLAVRGLTLSDAFRGDNRWHLWTFGVDGNGRFGLPLKLPGQSNQEVRFAGGADSVVHIGQVVDVIRLMYVRSPGNTDPVAPIEFSYTVIAADTSPRHGTINQPPPPVTSAQYLAPGC